VNGSDANSGLTPALAKQTITSALSTFNSMAAGDTVALCRTGAWDSVGNTGISNSHCGQGGAGWPAPNANTTTCDFRDYVPSWGTSSSAVPILNTTAGQVFSWGAGTAGKGFRFWNIEFNVPATLSGVGTWEIDSPTGYIDICNVNWHDGDFAFNDQSAALDSAGMGHYTIRNSSFYRSQDMAILGASDYLITDSNYFENNGLRNTPQMHATYYQQNCSAPGCIGGQIVNNHYVTSTALPPTGDLCGGVQMVIHGLHSGLIVENNLVENIGGANANCYGIQSAHSAANAAFVNMKIRRNRVINSPGTAIENSCCQNCLVSDNIVVNGSIVLNSDTACGTGTPGGTTTQNNDIYNGSMTYGAGGGAANVFTDNNAFYNTGCAALGDNAAGVITVTAPTTTGRQSNNYCRSSATAIWNNPTTDFTPLSPLIAAANQTFYDTPAVGSVAWSATDTGTARSPPSPAVDIGAMQH
jgi:hypothetical protein